MSQENTQQQHNKRQEDSSSSIESKVDEVLTVLRGSYEQEGLVTLVRNIHQILHDKETGLITRVKILEDERQMQKGWILGAGFAGGIIGWVINYLTGHK